MAAAAAHRRRGPRKRRARLILIGCAAILLSGAHGLAQEPCRPSVFLEGELELVGAIAQVLRQRGIGEQVGPGCPLVRARVERRGAEVLVNVIEENRRSNRVMADTTAAATFIESWARSDISAPLLAAQAFSVPNEPPPPLPPQSPRFAIGLGGETAIDVKATPWLGASVRGCVRAGPFCIGALWRMAGDIPAARSDGLRVQRMITDLLFTAELPLRIRRAVISPGVGIGVGWLHLDVKGSLAEDSSGSGSGGTIRSISLTENDGGLRAEARLILSWPVYRHLGIDLGLFLNAAFLGTSPILINLPTDDAEKPNVVSLPEMPWGMIRAVVGLSWGV